MVYTPQNQASWKPFDCVSMFEASCLEHVLTMARRPWRFNTPEGVTRSPSVDLAVCQSKLKLKGRCQGGLLIPGVCVCHSEVWVFAASCFSENTFRWLLLSSRETNRKSLWIFVWAIYSFFHDGYLEACNWSGNYPKLKFETLRTDLWIALFFKRIYLFSAALGLSFGTWAALGCGPTRALCRLWHALSSWGLQALRPPTR